MYKRKPIIIECVGPPGAGKTTICRYFSKCLHDKEDKKIYLLQDIKDHLHRMGLFQKLNLIIKSMFMSSPELVVYAYVLASYNIYSFDALYRFLKLSVLNRALEHFIKKQEANYILLDQWMIQELWSATIFKLVSYNKIATQLNRFYFRTDLTLYFDIDLISASERISNRETSLSRFDRMPPDKRLEELLKYNTYLLQLYQNSECRHKYIISTEDSLKENAILFCSYLEQYHQIQNKL